MLATPSATSRAEPGLHFVENQKDVVLVANLPQLPKPLAAEMIVAALTLDWFDDDRGDVDPAFIVEFGEQIRLPRIGIRKAHGVAAASMEGAPEMQNLGAAFPTTGNHVFAHLP